MKKIKKIEKEKKCICDMHIVKISEYKRTSFWSGHEKIIFFIISECRKGCGRVTLKSI